MNRYTLLTLMAIIYLVSQPSLAGENALKSKTNASLHLWEYERSSFLSLVKLSKPEVEELQAEKYTTNSGAQLLLSLNCVKPNESSHFYALYQYRCLNKPLFYLSSQALKDPYVLAFVKEEDREKALYHLGKYKEFLNEVQSSSKGIPIEVSHREYVLEIIAFLEAGGIGSNN